MASFRILLNPGARASDARHRLDEPAWLAEQADARAARLHYERSRGYDSLSDDDEFY